ncbi:MAG TPA: hypothetical protein VMU61_02050 [Candidatus Aquilonibacter sp.]|nr:hypothetical protein [Candidatus Aquilonibacter sp.]
MLSPTSGSHSSNTTQAAQAAQTTARQTQQQSQTQHITALPQDTVTLSRAARQGAAAQQGVAPKSTGDIDHDGDNH